MPMAYNIGGIVGPALGGALANPLKRKPYGATEGNSLSWKYPYALPNISSAFFFLFSAVVGTLYLRETLDSKQNRMDYGIMAGQKISGAGML
jgi:MFS family permease